jgi:hypothetical protein
MGGVLVQDRAQVPRPGDQHPVGDLSPDSAHPVGCQNSAAAADLRRLGLAGVLPDTFAVTSTRPRNLHTGTREAYRGYINSQSDDHAQLRAGDVPAGYTVRPEATLKSGHHRSPAGGTNAPDAGISIPRSATRITVATTPVRP